MLSGINRKPCELSVKRTTELFFFITIIVASVSRYFIVMREVTGLAET